MFGYIVLGIVQGLTEFIPVSSSAHLILARYFFGITTDQGLAVDAVLQLATVLAVCLYFWRDLWAMVWGRNWRLVLLLGLATAPALVAGMLLESYMETVFRDPHTLVWTLLAGSVVMVAAEVYARTCAGRTLTQLTITNSVFIGLFQCLALVPGMSRSGMTVSGGLFLGVTREAALRFSFLLSIPILLGTGLKKLMDLGVDGFLATNGSALFAGSTAAFVAGILSIHLLMRIVRFVPLTYFALYRVLLAGILLFAIS